MSAAQAETEKNLGNDALKAGDFAKAAEHYSKAIELNPTNHVYYSNRSNAYVQLKRYEEALSDANKTVELDPKFVRGYGRKGVALFFLGRYKDALAAYEAGLKLEPGNEGYQTELTRCREFAAAEPFLRPDWAGALGSSSITGPWMSDPKFVEKIQQIRSNPMLLPSMLNDSEVQQAFIVLSGLEHKMREDQRKADARRLDDQLKRKEEQKRKADEEIARKKREAFEALPENKQKALTSKEAGNEAYKGGDFNKALQLYTEASQHDPTDAVLLNNIAAAHIGLKDYNSALAACDKAIEVSKEHPTDYETIGKIYARKGKALAKLKRWRESVEAYDAGLVNHRDPVNVKFRNQAEEKMKVQEAEQYVDPAKAEEAKNAGNEFFKQENWGEAIRSYSEAIKRNPKSAVYYSNRAISYIKVREYTLALKDADKCLELDPSFLKGWVRKGMAHHYLKEYYKALEAYDKGMKIDPQYPELVEWAERTSQAIQRMRGGGESSKEEIDEARKRALGDPAIQALIADGEVQNLMSTLQSGNQKAAQEMIQKSASLFEKWQKLSKAGIM